MRWVDQKFRWRGARSGSKEIVIVGLDEKTLDKLGSARVFQRTYFATLVSKLATAHAKVIGFDITFQDHDVSNPENDRKFADAIQEARNVVLGLQLDMGGRGKKRPEIKLGDEMENIVNEKQNVFVAERTNGAPPGDYYRSRPFKPNLPELTKAAESFGFVNFDIDAEDGRLRYQPQVMEYGGRLYPSLDLQLLRVYDGIMTSPTLNYDQDGAGYVDNIQIGKYNVLTESKGRLMMNYNGPPGTYQTVSMIDVIEGRVPPELFKDKVVLIGATAVGLGDVVATPFHPRLPGVDLHATIIDNIIHNRYLYRESGQQAIDFAIILLVGLSLGYFLSKLNALRSTVYTVLLIGGFTAFNIWAFVSHDWVLAWVIPVLHQSVTAFVLISYKYVTEEREKKKTKQTFQSYLDQQVVEQVLSNPDMLKLGGEKRPLTVLFSDIRGFTSFSEKMAPEEVVHFLNQYFERMQAIIFRHHGTLDKLIGDAVMCFWGAPLETKEHAVRGVVTALEMIQAVDELRGVLVLPGGAKFDIGIGVNSGQMVFGNMGSSSRMSYTVMGDNVNLGSRLESLNKYYGTRIIISDSTYEEVKQMVYCRELDTIQVKGKSHAVTIYEPMGMRRLDHERRKRTDRRSELTTFKRIKRMLVMLVYGERRQDDRRLGSDQLLVKPEHEEIKAMYEHALALYRKGDFDGAEIGFDHVLSLNPSDGPSRLMKERIAKYRSVHAGDEAQFDPVYRFDEK
jgi:adenylate cyclase